MRISVNNKDISVSGQRPLIEELREMGINVPSMCYAEGKTNVRLRLCNSGKLMWPVWYTEKEDFLQWKKFYDEMMQKYS